jgi:cell division septation protein DedD
LTVAPPAPAQPPPAPAVRDSWTVSFAAVLNEARAREIAEGIDVDGQRPRVVTAQTAGTTVYRVVFGPYATKIDAERIGRASKHNYWVYEGVP